MIAALLVDDEAPARSELATCSVRTTMYGWSARRRPRARPTSSCAAGDTTSSSSTSSCPAHRARTGSPRPAPAIVFVTAHERYAVDAFAVEAFDYLLKPVSPDRLARVLDRLRARAPEPGSVEKIPVVAPGGTELLDFDQLYYLRAEGDYCRVHTYDRAYLSTSSLGELAGAARRGVRPHPPLVPRQSRARLGHPPHLAGPGSPPARRRGPLRARRRPAPVARAETAARPVTPFDVACDRDSEKMAP